jgi:uncharacterized protein with PQ loop repeat
MSDFKLFHFNNTETEMIFSQVFGWTSGLLCFAILIPQLVHIWKYKSAKDLSYWFLGLNQLCSTLFIGYALIIGSYPILVSDALIVCINTGLIVSKVILDKRLKDKEIIKDIELTEVKVKVEVKVEDK